MLIRTFLTIGWNIQILGFTVLLLGTLIYNELIMLPGLQSSPPMGRVDLLESLVEDTERDGLLG